MAANNPNLSQASSHAPLEAISGFTILHTELERRATLRPPCATGCREIDEATLVIGGFERGCVVGISAEEDDVALVVGLQTIARLLANDGAKRPRAVIVTTMSVGSLVGMLREVLRAQGVSGRERETDVLGRVAVSRVFDVNGLCEVLGELDALGPSQEVGEGLRTPEEPQSENVERELLVSPDGDANAEEAAAVAGKAYGSSRGCESAVPHTRAPGLMVCEDQGMEQEARHLREAPSSPLSDPPSSLPDMPPWENVQTAELAVEGTPTGELYSDKTEAGGVELPERTPPGQREEIQDSEEEDAGFSSPVAPVISSPRQSCARLSEPRSDTPASPPIEQEDQYDPPSQRRESSRGQDHSQSIPSAAEAVEFPGLGQEEGPFSPLLSKDRHEDDSHEKQPKIVPVEEPSAIDTDNFSSGASCKHETTRPDIILITHMSTLLSSLFHQREKTAAHQSLQLLASHLRYLARSAEHGSPLIMILNSTTSSEINVATPAHDQDRDGPPRPPPGERLPIPNKPLDPTLRSIFNPPPLPVSGLLYNYDTPHSRRNKPSFGLIFTQLLDLHLLCTRIPKTTADAETLYAPTSPGTGKAIEYVWAIEVLLDEMGVWESREKVLEGSPRRFRHQRWGVAQVRRDGTGVRIVDAFEKKAQDAPQQVLVSAGFGGRRV